MIDAGPLRVAARALVVEDGRVLLVRCEDERGPWYLLPGGGQESGATLHQTLQRECLEEIGTQVEIGPLVCVREFVTARHAFKYDFEHEVHQVDLIFRCRLDPRRPLTPQMRDTMQTGVEWVPVEALPGLRLYPRILAELLDPQGRLRTTDPYLGEME